MFVGAATYTRGRISSQYHIAEWGRHHRALRFGGMTQGPRGRCLIRACQSRCLTLCNGSAAIPHALGGVGLFVGVCEAIAAALSGTVISSIAHYLLWCLCSLMLRVYVD